MGVNKMGWFKKKSASEIRAELKSERAKYKEIRKTELERTKLEKQKLELARLKGERFKRTTTGKVLNALSGGTPKNSRRKVKGERILDLSSDQLYGGSPGISVGGGNIYGGSSSKKKKKSSSDVFGGGFI